MTVNSTMQNSYASSLNTHSQSGASGLAPSGFGSMMQQQVSDQLLSSLDSNGNGSIDKIEFSNAAKQLSQSSADLEKIFNTLDQNSDGSIDSNELLSALKQASQQPQNGVYSPKKLSAAAQPQNTTQSPSTASSTNDLQSILMRDILSAYSDKNMQSSGSSLSLSV